MKTSLNEFIDAVLAGSPISVEAKKAGVHPEQLRRKVRAHPDYAKAKADGKLRKPGLPNTPELDAAVVEAAISDVVGGMTVTDSAIKYGLAASTLTKKFHQAHPGVELPKGGAGGRRDPATREGVAKARVAAAKLALDRAAAALHKLDPAKPHDTPTTQEIADLKKKLETAEFVKGLLEDRIDKMDEAISELEEEVAGLKKQVKSPTAPAPTTERLLALQREANRTNAAYQEDKTPENLAAARAAADALNAAL